MKFKIYSASGYDWNGKEITINTIEELLDFRNKAGSDIIIQDDYEDEGLAIMIYDDYIE